MVVGVMVVLECYILAFINTHYVHMMPFGFHFLKSFSPYAVAAVNDPQKLQKVNQNKRNAHERSKSLRCSEHLRTYTHIHTYTIKKNSFGKWNTQVIAIVFVLRTDEQTLRQLLLALYTLN